MSVRKILSGQLDRNETAMSKIVSSILLVSVVMVIAVTSGYWMEALALSHVSFEQIALPIAYAEYDLDLFSNGGWNITVEVKNSGSADAVITGIFLNALPIGHYNTGSIALYIDNVRRTDFSVRIPLARGSSVRLLLQVERCLDGTGIQGCTSRTMLDLIFRTDAGIDCPVKIRLP